MMIQVLHVVIEPADAVIDLMGLAVPPLTHTRNGRNTSFVNVHEVLRKLQGGIESGRRCRCQTPT